MPPLANGDADLSAIAVMALTIEKHPFGHRFCSEDYTHGKNGRSFTEATIP
jgi:hypothetical protein